MTARFSAILRRTGGHRPPLQEDKNDSLCKAGKHFVTLRYLQAKARFTDERIWPSGPPNRGLPRGAREGRSLVVFQRPPRPSWRSAPCCAARRRRTIQI